MDEGDTLVFEKNAVFEDICIYINKNLKVIGNNATLKGLNNTDTDIITAAKLPSTYNALLYSAVIYSVNNTGVVISDLNIISKYPNYSNPNNKEYKTACIFAENSKNLTITGCTIDGASWGLFVGFQKNGCPNSIITNNKVSNQYTTGIICFGSQESVIINNTVKNAKNHGIDVRFKANGQNVIVFNNTVSGAKEGIYLLHSYGHKVYQNTILNSKISSITCYGSGNEYIFNNTLSGSRIAVLLGGEYFNVTIGKNTFKPDKLPFPPTFEYYVVQGENRFNTGADAVIGTYSDSKPVNITINDDKAGYKKGSLEITLKNSKGKAIANKTGTVTIESTEYPITTDANGAASVDLDLTPGNYTVNVHTISDYYNKAGNVEDTFTVKDDRNSVTVTAENKSVYLKTIKSGYKYSVTLKDGNGNVLANKSVTVVFNGETYNATTNDKGVATVTLKATKTGTKKVTVKFEGDDEFNAVNQTASIKIIKEASKLTASKKTFKASVKTKKYTVTLKSKTGKAISKAKLTLKVKGKTYKATTNSKGKATFKITKLTKAGKHAATIKFAGNTYYKSVSKTVKYITVKK
jgi:parallel beta-helix repeat protein